jgi:molybdopterin synthase sulfur carrier subunit
VSDATARSADPAAGGVLVRYWASAREAAGRPEERVDAATLAEALDCVRVRHAAAPRFAAVLAVCSFVVDGDPVGRRDPRAVRLATGSEVEVLPPFAGG